MSALLPAALLAGAYAYGLSVLNVAYRVALRVLKGYEADDKVALSLGGERLVLRGYVVEQCRVVKAHLVASLLEGYAVDLLVLDRSRGVRRVYLDDVIRALALLLKYGEGLGSVVGGDDSVAHLALKERGGGLVAGVAQGYEVAVAAHAVGSACACVSARYGRKLYLNVVDEVNLLQRVAERQADGGSGRRYVLEAGGRGQAGGGLKLAHELPTVERIEEVNVSGTAVEHFYGQFAFVHVNARRLLVRIASVL